MPLESGTGLPTRELETMGHETHATKLGIVPGAHTTSAIDNSER
jgi:hypothetical protein